MTGRAQINITTSSSSADIANLVLSVQKISSHLNLKRFHGRWPAYDDSEKTPAPDDSEKTLAATSNYVKLETVTAGGLTVGNSDSRQ